MKKRMILVCFLTMTIMQVFSAGSVKQQDCPEYRLHFPEFPQVTFDETLEKTHPTFQRSLLEFDKLRMSYYVFEPKIRAFEDKLTSKNCLSKNGWFMRKFLDKNLQEQEPPLVMLTETSVNIISKALSKNDESITRFIAFSRDLAKFNQGFHHYKKQHERYMEYFMEKVIVGDWDFSQNN